MAKKKREMLVVTSKVKEAVKEGANEVGSVYYSDAYSVKDDVDIQCANIRRLAEGGEVGIILYRDRIFQEHGLNYLRNTQEL